MGRDHQHNPGTNANAARIVREATASPAVAAAEGSRDTYRSGHAIRASAMSAAVEPDPIAQVSTNGLPRNNHQTKQPMEKTRKGNQA